MYRFLGNVVSPPASARGSRFSRSIACSWRRPFARRRDRRGAVRAPPRIPEREFNVLPLAEACARLHRNSLPARALSLTFDDGYANNADVALPILMRHGLSQPFS
jgi:hypothetical protein